MGNFVTKKKTASTLIKISLVLPGAATTPTWANLCCPIHLLLLLNKFFLALLLSL